MILIKSILAKVLWKKFLCWILWSEGNIGILLIEAYKNFGPINQVRLVKLMV